MVEKKTAAKKILNKVEAKASPKDTLDSLKLLHVNKVITHGDLEDVKEHAQGLAMAFIMHKRAGNIDESTSFLDWFENGNVADYVDDEDDEAEAVEDANPTQ